MTSLMIAISGNYENDSEQGIVKEANKKLSDVRSLI